MFLDSSSQLELGFKLAAGWLVSLCTVFGFTRFGSGLEKERKINRFFNKFVN